MLTPRVLVGYFLLFFFLLNGGHLSKQEELPDDRQSHNDSSAEIKADTMAIHEEDCSFHAVLEYLNLTTNKALFTMSRPVKIFHHATNVTFEMLVSSILDVREVDQNLIAHIRISMGWLNKHIYWNPEDFCGMEDVIIPTDALWKPDIIIEEMVEKDKTPVAPYLSIDANGFVVFWNDQVVVSSCKMNVYKFPFDIQRCNLTFRSLIYVDEEVKLEIIGNNETLTRWSRHLMLTQYEWLFLNMTVRSHTDNFYFNKNQTSIIYTIHIKRRSVLYIANFLVPVLFFLCLDLSSFLISDSGGEKLSFKVTVLLAVTVMQLILNEILPSSSDKIPLVAIYCIGVFGLMMLSLMETILVMYLIEKDAASQSNETNRESNLSRCKQSFFKEVKKCGICASVSDVSSDQTPATTKEDSSSQLTEVSIALGKVSNELEQIEKTMTAMNGGKEEKRDGYWIGVTKQINKVFIVFYLTSASVFLTVIFYLWSLP